eukprot:IDg21034t1
MKAEKSKVGCIAEKLRKMTSQLNGSNQACLTAQNELQKVLKENTENARGMGKQRNKWLALARSALLTMKRIRDPTKQIQELNARSIEECQGYYMSYMKLIRFTRDNFNTLDKKLNVMHEAHKALQIKNSETQKELETRKRDIDGATKIAHSAVM